MLFFFFFFFLFFFFFFVFFFSFFLLLLLLVKFLIQFSIVLLDRWVLDCTFILIVGFSIVLVVLLSQEGLDGGGGRRSKRG